ncbi:hypothetical protein FACS1894153_2570 [Bacteroidia bacterium]|nr:hypothetical protein FACS1894153_2570 [Bacteroidia bacterium]
MKKKIIGLFVRFYKRLKLSPLVVFTNYYYWIIIKYFRKKYAIKECVKRKEETGVKHYVYTYAGGKKFMVLSTKEESVLRRKKRIKRWSYAKLKQSCVYETK